MRYRLTCLTPVLVGDGEKLSAIDYMVWKDHVSVLNQRRIFRLLAKGPRLEGYLTQLKKADKLDFASWGGFAQNFADRRIPFEHASCSAYWDRASGESLNIPTFSCGASGPYLPGAAIKGVLRTGMLFANLKPGMLRDVAPMFQGDRPPRRPAEGPEAQALSGSGHSRMRAIAVGVEAKLAGVDRSRGCLVSSGWGGGLLSKPPWIDKESDSEQYRDILRNLPLYRRAIESGLPFPKTRRIVFQENKPASLPGWALIELTGAG